MQYNFELIFKLFDEETDLEELAEQLYENGCDAAIIGIGKKGYISLDFIEENADTLIEAISKVEKTVFSVLSDAELIEIKYEKFHDNTE